MTRRPPVPNRSLSRAPRAAGLIALAILLGFAACSDDDPAGPGAEVASIAIDAPATFLEVGQTLQLSATPRDDGGATVSADVAWSSSDASVATIGDNGLVHGVALGFVRATATAGNRSASIDLTVRELGPMLQGRIERPLIVLEPGLEYHAVADLELVADSLLILAGTLIVDGGVTVSIGSLDSTIITGNIVPANPAPGFAGNVRVRRAAPATVSDITLFGSKVNIGRASGQSEVTSTGSVNIGGIARPGVAAELNLEGTEIRAAAGVHGNSVAPNGGPGGNIEIGSEAARNAAAAAAGRPAAPFGYISFKGSVIARAGEGGQGFTIEFRNSATIANNTVTAVAGSGGRGGSTHVEAGDVSFMSSTVLGLFGGKGGDGGWVAFNIQPEVILDGTGPNGEGESLTGTTGSGNQGGDVAVVGNIIGGAGNVIEAGRGGAPGNFFANGGDGRNGGAGGNFTARIGTQGSGGAGVVGGNPAPAPEAAHRALVRIENSMNGGAATSPEMTGGAGGNLNVADATGNAPGYVDPINAPSSMNGGIGFNGCIVDPQTNGTTGGPGGTFKAFGVALGNSAISFLGGIGGSGLQPGAGGVEGRNLDTDTPLGQHGPDGGFCPTTLLISSTTTLIAFTHIVGASPCPQPITIATVKNETNQQISVTPTVVDTNTISWNVVGSFALGPGESRSVEIRYDCMPPFLSFQATFRFVAQYGAYEQILGIPIVATIVP